MTEQSLLRSESGGLRPLWRVLIFCIVATLAYFFVALFTPRLIAGSFDEATIGQLAAESWAAAVALLAATWYCVRVVDRRPFSDVWMNPGAARPASLAFGFLAGAFAIGVPIAMLILAHWLRETPSSRGSWIGAGLRVSLFLLPAALIEELMVRGYLLSVLRESWGWPAAIVVTSVAFGLLHAFNPGVTVRSIVLVTLAGVFLAGVLYATKSLYAAWMAHFAWNWMMAVVFHTAVSGLPLESPRYRYVDAGPDWATGGEWGPEGGVPAGLGMIAGMAFVFARGVSSRKLRESQET